MRLKSLLLISLLSLTSSMAFAQSQEEKDLFQKIVSQGVPSAGLQKIFNFLAKYEGASFVQDVYVCAGKEDNDSAFCAEGKQRSRASRKIKIKAHKYAVLIDFSKASIEKRMFVINMQTGDVQSMRATHGRGTGEQYAYKFSNTKDSKQTSLGMFVTGGTYKSPNHGLSLKMYGLEKSNDQAYIRDIVMHGAWYANEDFITKKNYTTGKPYGRLGQSWGCPAISDKIAVKVIEAIKDGALIYHHHPLADEALSGREVRMANPEKAVTGGSSAPAPQL